MPPAAGTPISAQNPNYYTGYVVPNNYDANAHGALPPGVRTFDGKFASTNSIPLSNFGPRIGFAWLPTGSSKLAIRGGFGMFYDRIGINQLVHAVQEGKPYADTLAAQGEISSLQRPFQERPLAFAPRWFNFQTLSGSNFDSPQYSRIQTPLVRQFNLGVQYEIFRGTVAEVAYVGSSGINLANYSHNINSALLACTALVTSGCVKGGVNGITTNTIGNANARVPFLGFSSIGLQQMGFDGISNYNSLQFTVRKNMARGLSFQSAYTWSKALSTIGYTASNLNDSNNPSSQYGAAPFNRPHRLSVSYQYAIPSFAKSGFANKAFGNWNLSGVTTIQAGNPVTFFDNNAGTAYHQSGGSIEKGFVTAQLAPGKTYNDIFVNGSPKDKLNNFFNIKAFGGAPILGDDGVATGYGNSGIGVIRGPHQLNFDASLNKDFKLTERQRLQFRVDSFNLFNHAQFAFANQTISNGNFNFVSSPVNNFGVVTKTSVAPRLIQLALRYQF